MIAALIYALFLYRKKITVLRLFGAKFLVNYLVNVGLGSLWSQMLYGKGYLYYLVKSLIKNSLLLPLEVIALAALFAVLVPVFSRLGLLPEHETRDLRRLTVSSSAFTVFGLSSVIGGGCSLYYRSTLGSGGTVFHVLGIVLLALGVLLLIAGPVLLPGTTKRRRPEFSYPFKKKAHHV